MCFVSRPLASTSWSQETVISHALCKSADIAHDMNRRNTSLRDIRSHCKWPSGSGWPIGTKKLPVWPRYEKTIWRYVQNDSRMIRRWPQQLGEWLTNQNNPSVTPTTLEIISNVFQSCPKMTTAIWGMLSTWFKTYPKVAPIKPWAFPILAQAVFYGSSSLPSSIAECAPRFSSNKCSPWNPFAMLASKSFEGGIPEVPPPCDCIGHLEITQELLEMILVFHVVNFTRLATHHQTLEACLASMTMQWCSATWLTQHHVWTLVQALL